MSFGRRAALVGAGLLLVIAHPLAHHSLTSEFDVNRPVMLTGRVTRVEWVNPHAWLYIDVAGEHAGMASWRLQMGSPNSLVRRGWTRNSVRVGDVITAVGIRAKDGSEMANIRSVVLPSRVRLLTGPADGQTS